MEGTIRDGEKACFVSHFRALELSTHVEGHVLVMEDDAMFGPHTCQVIETAAGTLPADGWDVLFTDACIPTVSSMLELLLLRRQLVAAAQFKILDLKDMRFAGATAYIVNARSKDKLIEVLKNEKVLDTPYDLFLRKLIYDTALGGFLIFPFATSISEYAERSQLQTEETEVHDAAWNAFRKLMWLDRSVGDATRRLDALAGTWVDDETAAFAKILSVLLSPTLPVR